MFLLVTRDRRRVGRPSTGLPDGYRSQEHSQLRAANGRAREVITSYLADHGRGRSALRFEPDARGDECDREQRARQQAPGGHGAERDERARDVAKVGDDPRA